MYTGLNVYSYGIVIDAGSSSSKVQLYRWPPHNGNPASLLLIEPISDEYGLPLRKKIEPGMCMMGVLYPLECEFIFILYW